MIRNTTITAAILAMLAGASSASAQFSIIFSTIDGGGGRTTGGTFELTGTIGQPDASAPLTGGSFEVTGGFWVVAVVPAACYANCDGSTATALSPADFTCFLGKYRAGDSYADCDGSGGLSPADFTCFLSKYRAGCP